MRTTRILCVHAFHDTRTLDHGKLLLDLGDQSKQVEIRLDENCGLQFFIFPLKCTHL